MKKMIAVVIVVLFVTNGCATLAENKGGASGALSGGLLGGGLGYAIDEGRGAGIGTALGALLGWFIGHEMDKQERELKKALADSEAASINREQRAIADAENRAIEREQDVLVLSFKSDFWFDFDSAVLNSNAYTEIDRVAEILNLYPQTSIRVEGHTDSEGDEDYNLKLSERRALAVKNALFAQGVDNARIETVGFGDTKPLADNNHNGGQQLNRRVEIVIVPVAKS